MKLPYHTGKIYESCINFPAHGFEESYDAQILDLRFLAHKFMQTLHEFAYILNSDISRITLTSDIVSSMKSDASELDNDVVLQCAKVNQFRVA